MNKNDEESIGSILLIFLKIILLKGPDTGSLLIRVYYFNFAKYIQYIMSMSFGGFLVNLTKLTGTSWFFMIAGELIFVLIAIYTAHNYHRYLEDREHKESAASFCSFIKIKPMIFVTFWGLIIGVAFVLLSFKFNGDVVGGDLEAQLRSLCSQLSILRIVVIFFQPCSTQARKLC